MSTFLVKILTAERPFYEGECEYLGIPTSDGQYGIMAHHSNMIAAIVPGMLLFRKPNGEDKIGAVSNGLIKVENNEVLLLVDTIESPEEIDINRAQRAEEEAKEALLQKRSAQEYNIAQARMARAVSRLKVKGMNR
jgi:F-type H+-transporting ATPase subunit epsilon